MKREVVVLLVLAVLSILLINVFVRLEYMVLPQDYSIILYGLADKMLETGEIRYYPYPLHLDSWDQLAIAKETIKREKIVDYNPYLGENHPDRNWEKAYTLLLAETVLLTGIKPLYLDSVFPTVVGFILALNAFILVRYLTKSMLAGLFSAIFMLTFKSSSTLTGIWFSVPVAYGIAMMPLMLYMFIKAADEKGNTWKLALIILFTQVTLAHPPSAIIYLPIFGLYLVTRPRLVWENKEKILVAGFLMLLLALQFAPAEKIIKELSFGDEPPEGAAFQPVSFLGLPATLLSLVGGIWCFRERKKRILPLAFLALLPFMTQFYLTNRIFLSPFRRLFSFEMALALLMAGIGLWAVYHRVNDIIENRRVLQFFVLVAVALLLFNQMDSGYRYRHLLITAIIEDDVIDIKQLEDTPPGSKILTNSFDSRGIWFIGERQVISLMVARVRGDNKINSEANRFCSMKCEDKEKIIRELKADYVVYTKELECPFLKEIYNRGRGSKRIYEYIPGR
ncbi:MAG: hypothetical protein U9M95_00030 [Candidatus Altiarchaeota archaeon]|nr:hypothetical protein [Candidatus Altiarchaeota archaeon]